MLTQTSVTDEDLKLIDMFINIPRTRLGYVDIKFVGYESNSVITYEYKNISYSTKHSIGQPITVTILVHAWCDNLKEDMKKWMIKNL